MNPTVDFITFCYSKDKEELYKNLLSYVDSHNYEFNEIHVIHQRTPATDSLVIRSHEIKEEDYDTLLKDFNINHDNKEADHYTHGWDAPHYWKHHLVNHLKGLQVSKADYIVFSDSDCRMLQKTDWLQRAIHILKNEKQVLVVSPNDGGQGRYDTTMSQQLFICERERLKSIDFDLLFEGFKDGGPFPEYYFMLEGRIGRYMEKNRLYRYVLRESHRYWHGAP